MAEIRELVFTFLERLSHHALPKNRKRETLDACIQLTLSKDRFYAPNELCTFCGIESETVNTLVHHCSGKRVHLMLQDVLLRKFDAEIEIFN